MTLTEPSKNSSCHLVRTNNRRIEKHGGLAVPPGRDPSLCVTASRRVCLFGVSGSYFSQEESQVAVLVQYIGEIVGETSGFASQDQAGPVRPDTFARRSEPQPRPRRPAHFRPERPFVTSIPPAAQAAPAWPRLSRSETASGTPQSPELGGPQVMERRALAASARLLALACFASLL